MVCLDFLFRTHTYTHNQQIVGQWHMPRHNERNNNQMNSWNMIESEETCVTGHWTLDSHHNMNKMRKQQISAHVCVCVRVRDMVFYAVVTRNRLKFLARIWIYKQRICNGHLEIINLIHSENRYYIMTKKNVSTIGFTEAPMRLFLLCR